MKAFKNIYNIVFTVLLFTVATNAKTFTKCELAKNLDSLGFSRASLPDCKYILKFILKLHNHFIFQLFIGICLVKYESSYRTDVKGPVNTDGTYDWGLFQINDGYWCEVGRAGKGCNIDCNGNFCFKY